MPFSLRELQWLAKGRQMEAWGRTSAILAWLENTSLGKKGRPTLPIERNPFREVRRRKLSKVESARRLDQMFGIKRKHDG